MTSNNPSNQVANKSYSPTNLVSSILHRFSQYYSRTKSYIYDAIILHMTETWYRSVLSKLDNNSIILDVGVGTGGALLKSIDLIQQKELKIVGIDIDEAYVSAGKLSIQQLGMEDRISIDVVDVYGDKSHVMRLAKKLGAQENEDGQFIDAVYFSGSFSLLPNPVKALQLVSKYIKNDGCIYITQTYQRKTPFFLPYIKPWMKYVTTIDFGNLVREEEVLETFKESDLEVLEHDVIPRSVDNIMQAAYLSVLR